MASSELNAVGSDGRIEQVRLEVEDTPRPTIRLHRFDGNTEEFAAPDLWECLRNLRLHLEGFGLLLCCQGARPNVSPSGMTRQMSNGRLAYPLRRTPPLTDSDLVDVFSPADPSEVGTVEQQKEFVKSFFGSYRKG